MRANRPRGRTARSTPEQTKAYLTAAERARDLAGRVAGLDASDGRLVELQAVKVGTTFPCGTVTAGVINQNVRGMALQDFDAFMVAMIDAVQEDAGPHGSGHGRKASTPPEGGGCGGA